MEGNIMPARVPSPGNVLAMELEAREWSQSDLAALMDRPEQLISEIINAKKQITPETALELSEALGTSAEFWMNLESSYRLHLARQQQGPNQSATARRARLRELAPYIELRKLGWLDEGDSLAELEQNLQAFLNPPGFEQLQGALFRSSAAHASRTTSIRAWLARIAGLAHKREPRGLPDLPGLQQNIESIAEFSAQADGPYRMEKVLAEYGIAYLVVPHLKKAHTDGAALWLAGLPVIAMSLRYSRVDNYWFTLMHEIAHLVLGHESAVDGDFTESSEDPQEMQANQWAQNVLIPPEAYQDFLRTKDFSAKHIQAFAAEISRHPGVVVGRLRYDRHLAYNQHNRLLGNNLDKQRMITPAV